MAKVNKSLEMKTRVNLDPDALRWTPVVSGPSSLYGSPFKRDGMFGRNRMASGNSNMTSSPEKGNTSLNSLSGGRAAILEKSPIKSMAAAANNSNSNSKNSAFNKKQKKKRKKQKKRSSDEEQNTTTTTTSADEDSDNTDSDRKAVRRGRSSTATVNGPTTSGKASKSSATKKTRSATAAASTSGNKRASKKSTASGESKGLDGGIININTNSKKKSAAPLTGIQQRLTFQDNDEKDDDTDNEVPP